MTAADGSDCHLRSGHTEHLVPNGASADWCSGFYPYIIGSVFGYWDAFVNHVNVGMCFNGYVAYKNWENCYTSVYIDLFGADQPSWCGVWNNNTYSTQPGDNFDWFLWGAPWVKYYGYLRKPVYGNGTSGATFGCITNGICM